MKRKSYYMLISSRMMVSRTTSIRMCVLLNLIIFISVCVNNVCALNSNEKYLINNTTPMVPLAKNNSNYPNISSISSNSLKNLNNIKNIPINTDNSTLSTGNELWDGIIRDCYRKPTFSCFQKNMFTYLDNKLDTSDVNVTNRLLFRRNKVDYEKYSREANDLYHDEKENEIPHDEPRSESPIEEVTDALYGKGVKFMMTHDIELKMPEIMFDGALFRISPQKIEGNGAIVKLELIPKQEIENRSTGRIFKKHIYKFFKNKLLLSFFALILIVKLIKIKLFWLLPIIIGVGKAKALLLKILLFFFPALAHIFKLCSYYHNNFHQTKYHHHHHSINHHHTGVPPWFHDHEPHSSVVIPNGPELIFTNPPKGNPAEFLHNGPKPHAHHPNDWEFSGPGLGPEYISDIHRNGVDGSVIGHGGGGGGGGGGGAAGVGVSGVGFGNFKPKLDDVNDIHAWGLGTTHPPGNSHSYNSNPFYPDPSRNVAQQKYKQQQMQFQQQQHQQHQQQQHHQQQQPQQQLGPVYVHNLQQKPPQAAAQIAAQYDPMINQQIANNVHLAQAQVKEAIRIQNEQRIIAQQQKILQQQPFVQDVQKIRSKDYDPFYTPIMSKIDKILLQLGLADDACKERMVCSMYKNPARYSPHSNFISAELSRDTSELQKPTTGSPLVTRFHRMVQAARDGQEQRDCMHIYSQCAITTE